MNWTSRAYLMASLLTAPPTFSQQVEMIIDRGAAAFPAPRAEQEFVSYLTARRGELVSASSQLSFQSKFTDGTEMMRALDSRAPHFVNRDHNCTFLTKLATMIESTDERRELTQITRSGKICVAGDLPAEEQATWSLSIQRFIWQSHWLPFGSKHLNAPEFIAAILGDKTIPAIEIKSWRDVEFDASYASMSSKDRDFIKRHNHLQNLVDRFRSFDIDDLTTVPEGMIRTYAKGNIAHVGDVFYQKPTIWISPSIGPADAVDALFHEFGHILFDMRHGHFSMHGDTIRYTKEQLLDETCAESFSWIILRRLYEQLPEIEFAHIFKTYGFSQIKRSDPLYTGAASVFNLLKDTTHELQSFKHLIASRTLADFLLSERLEPVIPTTSFNVQFIHMP